MLLTSPFYVIIDPLWARKVCTSNYTDQVHSLLHQREHLRAELRHLSPTKPLASLYVEWLYIVKLQGRWAPGKYYSILLKIYSRGFFMEWNENPGLENEFSNFRKLGPPSSLLCVTHRRQLWVLSSLKYGPSRRARVPDWLRSSVWRWDAGRFDQYREGMSFLGFNYVVEGNALSDHSPSSRTVVKKQLSWA